MDYLPWALSFIGIVGAITNIKKMKICFVIWSLGNLGWMALAISTPTFRPQVPLWVVFTILNVYGWVQWRKDETSTK